MFDQLPNSTTITIAYGDGVGVEIMDTTLLIMRESGADITIESVEIGERVYNMGSRTGIIRSSWDVLSRNKILLKAPTLLPYTLTPDGQERISTDEAVRQKFELPEAIIHGSGMEAWAESIGDGFAMFSAAHPHDFTPQIAGKNLANPTGMILASIAMLNHIGQTKYAKKIDNALAQTIAEGIHTADIYQKGKSQKKVETKQFGEEIINRIKHHEYSE